jgi:hypothetical protein
MRRVALATCSVAIFVAFATTPVHATTSSSNMGDIIETLQGSSVYIAPGTEGTNSDTAAMLERQILESDQIVIVILPSDAESTSEEVQQLTQDIADKLDDSAVVGISIGESYDAASDLLPAGVADELMKKADTVSQSPIDTMSTFIRNVHNWERLHPDQVVKTETVEVAPSDGINPVVPIGGVSVLVLSGALITALILRRRRRIPQKRVKYTAPGVLNDSVSALMRASQSREIKDTEMAEAIIDVCRHSEAYFNKLSRSDRRDTAQIDAFQSNFERIRRIVDTYGNTVREPEYAPSDPIIIKKKSVEAVNAFAEKILHSVRSKNRELMLDFEVNVKMITAQKPHRFE